MVRGNAEGQAGICRVPRRIGGCHDVRQFANAAERVTFTFEYWDPPWSLDEAESWPAHVGEEWRRFLVRVALRGALRQASETEYKEEQLEQFRELFGLSQYSGGVARRLARDELPLFSKIESDMASEPMADLRKDA